LALVLSSVLFSPIIISWWGAKNILRENLLNSIIFIAVWAVFDYAFLRETPWNQLLVDQNVVLPILCCLAIALDSIRNKFRDRNA
jgi:hypothetical protein